MEKVKNTYWRWLTRHKWYPSAIIGIIAFTVFFRYDTYDQRAESMGWWVAIQIVLPAIAIIIFGQTISMWKESKKRNPEIWKN